MTSPLMSPYFTNSWSKQSRNTKKPWNSKFKKKLFRIYIY